MVSITTLKNCCFTLNNYTIKDIKNIFEIPYNYIVLGYEEGKQEHTKHIQGFISLKKVMKFNTIKKHMERAHIEKMNGTKEQAANYCKKDGSFIEDGLIEEQGSRTDLYINCMIDIENGMKLKEIIKTYPKIYIKHKKNIDEIITEKHFDDSDDEPDFTIKNLYKWQQDIIDMIKKKPDNRTINWVYDKEGGKGKTALIKHILTNFRRSIAITTTDNKNVAYSINKQKIIMFNFSRQTEDFINYGTLEQLKDGLIFNSKYESKMKLFKSPHIFVFANFEPNLNRLTKDRWNIINL